MHEFKDYDTIQVRIGDRFYTLWVADTTDRKRRGLRGVSDLPVRNGMIFTYNTPVRHPFTMKGVNIPLRIIFIDDTHQVVHSETCYPGRQESVIPDSDYMYVIEIGT